MRVIVFGGTGMVGQGVLRECVLDPDVAAVVSVVRRATGPMLGRRSDKVREVVPESFYDYSRIEKNFVGGLSTNRRISGNLAGRGDKTQKDPRLPVSPSA